MWEIIVIVRVCLFQYHNNFSHILYTYIRKWEHSMNRQNNEEASYVIRMKCYICFYTYNNLLSHLNSLSDKLITLGRLYSPQPTTHKYRMSATRLWQSYTHLDLFMRNPKFRWQLYGICILPVTCFVPSVVKAGALFHHGNVMKWTKFEKILPR